MSNCSGQPILIRICICLLIGQRRQAAEEARADFPFPISHFQFAQFLLNFQVL